MTIDPVFGLLVFITLLFFVLLLVKKWLGLKMCVICTSISLTWLGLLILYWLNKFSHPLVIAVLMGQSIVGVYYLLEKKLPEKYQVFRLPFLLTATLAVYLLLKFPADIFLAASWLIVLWFICLLFYIYRDRGILKKMFDRVVACCRDW